LVLFAIGDPFAMSQTAATPGDLPKRAWGPTLVRTLKEFKDDKLQHWAAALTYYAVLSIFPALLVMVALVGLLADPATVTKFLTDVISSLGPASAVDTFSAPIESVTRSGSQAGIAAIIGVVAALWSASGYVGAFTDASNVIYEVEEGRPFYKLKPIQLFVTFICIALVAITALALVVSGPLAEAIGSALGLSDVAVTAWQIGKWPVMLLLILVILHVLYYAAPNADVKRPWISRGTVLTLVVWILASAAFAFYVANFGSYNETYGTLGGVVVFLLWLWITNISVLLGVEFNAETERTRELYAGVDEAEEELQLPERDEPKDQKRPRAA
jgi:membrane protein